MNGSSQLVFHPTLFLICKSGLRFVDQVETVNEIGSKVGCPKNIQVIGDQVFSSNYINISNGSQSLIICFKICFIIFCVCN